MGTAYDPFPLSSSLEERAMFNILVNNTISLTHSNIGILPGQELPEAIGQNGYISL